MLTVSFLSLRNKIVPKCLSSNGGNNIYSHYWQLNVSHVCDFWKEGWSHFRMHVCFVVVWNQMKSVRNCCQLIEINCFSKLPMDLVYIFQCSDAVSHVCDFWKEGWSHFREHVCFVVWNQMKSVWNCCQLTEINCLFQNCQWI